MGVYSSNNDTVMMNSSLLIEKLMEAKSECVGAPMSSKDMLALLDLLFAQAGVDHTATVEDLATKFGPNGLELIMRFYHSLAEKESGESQGSDGLTVSEMSDEEENTSNNSSKRGKYKKETEIAMSRIFSLGKVVPPVQADIKPHDPYTGPNVISMTGFGELGRFGNQLIQYAFLRCYAKLVNADVQVPYWVGKDLFGLDDLPVQRALPAVVETQKAKANSTFTDEFLGYIVDSNRGKPVPEIEFDFLKEDVSADRPVNVDVWGWFQWHTKTFAPFKDMIQECFTPVAPLKAHFDDVIDAKLRQKGKRTVVGCHLRLGDYKNIAASSFGYCAPTSWYLEWLEKLWPTLENPILFVASDEVETVLRDFAKFNPVTAESIGAEMPEGFASLDANFFPDWYILSQCDHVAISNSTFSFSACMMNTRPNAQFYRAHYANKIMQIDPWCDEVIVHRNMEKNALSAGVDTLRILYDTQGTRGLLQNVLYELPYYAMRSFIMKAVFKARSFTRKNSFIDMSKTNDLAVQA